MNDTTLNIIAQCVGFVAMGFGVFSMQPKKRTTILLMLFTANVLWTLHFVLLQSPTGIALNALSIIRNLVFLRKGKSKIVDSKWTPILWACLYIAAGILTWEAWFSAFSAFAMVVQTFALYMTKEKHIRYMSLIVSPSWLIYDAFSHSIAGVCSETFAIISIIIALIRHRHDEEPA